MKDDLVERCAEAVKSEFAKAIAECGIHGARQIVPSNHRYINALLAIVRPAILDEAAQVATARKPLYTHPSGQNACAEIASSIRGLATTGQEGGR